jgi:hypothetical protein
LILILLCWLAARPFMPIRILSLTVALFLATIALRAEPLLPTASGTSWQYDSKEEFGGPIADRPVEAVVTVRAGTQLFEGRQFVKFETFSGDALTGAELVSVSDGALLREARRGKDGKLAKLDPPQIILPAALKVGDTWDSEDEVLGNPMQQHFAVVAEEPISVPAGRFRAFHLHCEDSSTLAIKLDRWVVPGTGFVKEVATVRGPTGGLLQRLTRELRKAPEAARPSPTATPASTTPVPQSAAAAATPDTNQSPVKKLTVEVSGEPGGGLKTEFKSDAPNIYVRWHGHYLPVGATVRVAWVAEDVGDLVDPNFIVDETESVAPTPDASARFTLGRPPDGWAEGKYRLEFYVNDELVETIKVTIAK